MRTRIGASPLFWAISTAVAVSAFPAQGSTFLFSEQSSAPTFQTLDDAGATAYDAGTTKALGLNNSGQVVGKYASTGAFVSNGFYWNGSSYTTLDYPTGAVQSQANGINSSGEVVGLYVDAATTLHGFTDIGGTFTAVNVTNGVTTFQTNVDAVNDLGQMDGLYRPNASSTAAFYYDGVGAFTLIPKPFSTAVTWSATGLNNGGEIAGVAQTALGQNQFQWAWFLPSATSSSYNICSVTTSFTLSCGATALTTNVLSTQVYGLDGNGDFAGTYIFNGVNHGFTDIGGVFSLVDACVPGVIADGATCNSGTTADSTIIYGINNLGQLAGAYTSGGNSYGFVTLAPQVQSAPEPTTALTLVGGGLLLAGLRKRRSR